MGIQIYTQLQPLPPVAPKAEIRADNAPTPVDPAKAVTEQPPSFSSYLGEHHGIGTPPPTPTSQEQVPAQQRQTPQEVEAFFAERRKADRRQKQIPVLLDTRSYHRRRASDQLPHIDDKA